MARDVRRKPDRISLDLLGLLINNNELDYGTLYFAMKTKFPEIIKIDRFDYIVRRLRKAGYVEVERCDGMPGSMVLIMRTKSGTDAYRRHVTGMFGDSNVSDRFSTCGGCGNKTAFYTGGSDVCGECGYSTSAD